MAGLLTVNEAAARLRCSRWTVRRLADAGEIPVIRVGDLVRIDSRDIDRFIEDQRHPVGIAS